MINTTTLPTDPGVYLFKDRFDHIIYVGKAKNLRKRVSSYFRKSNQSLKTTFLVKNISDMDFIAVNSEIEALLLENKLIKKHKPKYNIHLKDSKTFAYLVLTHEKFPRILSTRKQGLKATYFGPYTSGFARREIQHLCVELFKLRTCRTLPKRACLNYHIGLCTAPCVNKVNEEQYAHQVEDALLFLKGNTKPTLKCLKEEMEHAAQSQRYELALEKRNQIHAIEHLGEKQNVDLLKRFDQDVVAIVHDDRQAVIEILSISKGVILGKKEFRFDYDVDILESFLKLYYSREYIPHEIIINEKIDPLIEIYLRRIKGSNVSITQPKRGEKKSLIKIAEKNAVYALENVILKEIQDKLNLPTLPRVIECFDISNLGNQFIVGGMTQWREGKSYKPGYRKFDIRGNHGQDDFASMKEVVFRRYSRLREEGWSMPDLIIIDGGKGQLGIALSSLKSLGLHIPIIGLAKKDEEIYLPGEEEPRSFGKNTKMMLLIRNIRDSVHHFVLSYNKKKREMALRKEENWTSK